MHTNVILTNRRCTHAQSNYTNTKLKAWLRRLLWRPARKGSGPILHLWTHTGGLTLFSTINILTVCNKYEYTPDSGTSASAGLACGNGTSGSGSEDFFFQRCAGYE